jgi:hypothetical protein
MTRTATTQLRRSDDPAELGGDPNAPENADAFKAFNDLAALHKADKFQYPRDWQTFLSGWRACADLNGIAEKTE